MRRKSNLGTCAVFIFGGYWKEILFYDHARRAVLYVRAGYESDDQSRRRADFLPSGRIIGKTLSLGMCSFLAQISLVGAMAAINNMTRKYGAGERAQ